MMSLRRVRRVSLRAPSEALVRRGALLLEDALRTASWPMDVPGRLLVVRRLDVGRIDPEESPAALSLRVEARLRDLGARAVPADAPSAERAEIVLFRDAVEPAVRLAEHVARSAAPAPWFVARAVPAYCPEAGPRHALRAALAAARAASPAGAMALVEALLSRGAADPLFAALEPRDGLLLLADLGLASPGPVFRASEVAPERIAQGPAEPPGDARRPAAPPDPAGAPLHPAQPATAPPAAGPAPPFADVARRSISPAFHAALAARVPAWGASDARAVWLAAAALISRAPALRHDPRLPARAAALSAAFARAPLPGRTAPDRGRDEGAAPAPTSSPWTATAGAWSAWGGLLFLVPLLSRLGMPAFLAAHPALAEAELPLHLLHDVARRLGAPPDDPLLLALGAPWLTLPDGAVTAPEALARVAGPPPRACAASPPPATPLALYRAALRRLTRRVIGIGLHGLVVRPARVTATRTHVDLALDMRRVHVGIRRAGADVDPGYVPWLGRVVHFHYRRGEEPHA